MIKLHRDPSRKISQTARVQLRPEALERATRRDLLQIKSLHMAFDLMNCWENQQQTVAADRDDSRLLPVKNQEEKEEGSQEGIKEEEKVEEETSDVYLLLALSLFAPLQVYGVPAFVLICII